MGEFRPGGVAMWNLSKLPPVPAPCLPGALDKNDPRANAGFALRYGIAATGAQFARAPQTPNQDETKYADKSATYSKGLKQKGYGIVDPDAFKAFRAALGTSDGITAGTMNFEDPNIILGGYSLQHQTPPFYTPLDGPAGAFALPLAGADSEDFAAPPAFEVDSIDYALELIELYWASLLRDAPFSEYHINPIAIAAANGLTKLRTKYGGHYYGPVNASGMVTPDLLFRGGPLQIGDKTYFAGEDVGPYVSQFCIAPTRLGAQPIDQKMLSYAPGINYLTDLDAWYAAQNGKVDGANVVDGVRRHMSNGRALSSYTHMAEISQAYFVAYLVLTSSGIEPNRTNPYGACRNQKPFGTFGGPDIAATLGAVAKAALNAVWYQKWIVHLRHRPEAGSGLVYLMMTKPAGIPLPQAPVHEAVLDSAALYFSQFVNHDFGQSAVHGSFLLSQAFPEGSPTHPSYPAGHGAVAGACITVLKFFFDGDAVFERPVVPSADGLALEPYTGPHDLTVNGELHKLAHNISFGHGIHAGIHWRSDTDQSIILGEQVALRFLQDQVFSYSEKVKVTITLLNGEPFTITNQ
jgi:hypothetical protein